MRNRAIKVEDLWKQYTLVRPERQHRTLYEALGSALSSPFRRLRELRGAVGEDERFWALRGVNLGVEQGEVVGVIGRNGAGKSTLLKVLSRVTAPTRGRVEVRGRLASLLEVGSGFHPELSGRENIILNAAILGMRRREVLRKLDEIVEFAEVSAFLDTPVKRYSSGMYVRLAFAVAAHLDADVLLVDEVLAVGDASFQQKSLGKMGDVAKQGRTVLFVSHNLAAIRSLCSRTVLLESGSIALNGETREVVTTYEIGTRGAIEGLGSVKFDGPLAETVLFEEITVSQKGKLVTMVDVSEEVTIEVRGIAKRALSTVDLDLQLFRESCHIATFFDTREPSPLAEGSFVSRFWLPPDILRPGRYTIGVGGVASMGSWVWGGNLAVLDCAQDTAGNPPHRVSGAVSLPYRAKRVL